MPKELFEFLNTAVPGWIFVPCVLVLWLVALWPKIRQIWTDLLPVHKEYRREKMRLELLKLRYEIEAIKQANNLGDLEEQGVGALTSPRIEAKAGGDLADSYTEEVEKESQAAPPRASGDKTVDSVRRLGFGTLGGILVQIYLLVIHAQASSVLRLAEFVRQETGFSALPMLLVIAVALTSGVITFLVTDEGSRSSRCLTIGLVAAAALLSFVPFTAPPLGSYTPVEITGEFFR